MSNLLLTVGASGLLRNAHYVVPTGKLIAERTLLVEPAGTNLVLNSGEPDHVTSWTRSRATVTPNVDIAPDGTLVADRLVEDTGVTTSHRVYSTVFTITADGNVCVSRFMKRGTRSWAVLGLIDSLETNRALVYFDLANGAVGSEALLGTGTILDAGVRSWGRDWYRCWATANLASGITSARHYTGLASGDGGQLYTGDGASFAILGWAQAENGAVVPSSYIPSGATATTRVADSLYLDYPAAPEEMTVYVRGIDVGTFVVTGANKRILNIGTSNPGNPPRLSLGVDSIGRAFASVADGSGGATQQSLITPSPVPVRGDIVEWRATWDHPNRQTRCHVSVNGGSEASGELSAGGVTFAAWAAARVYLAGLTSESAPFAYTHIAIAKGTQTLKTMRRLAGLRGV